MVLLLDLAFPIASLSAPDFNAAELYLLCLNTKLGQMELCKIVALESGFDIKLAGSRLS